MTARPHSALSVPLSPGARQGNTAFATRVALLMVRLALGWTFIFHGAQHAFGAFYGPGIQGFSEALAHMPLPSFFSPTVWAVIAAYGEFLGGISVFVGVFARLGAVPIIATMLIAIANVHGANGFSMQTGDVHKIGYEYNLNLIAEAMLILIAGPGLISLDAVLFRRGFWARGPQPLSEPTPRPQNP